MSTMFNHRLKQVILLAIIVLLAILLLQQLYVFLPGILGAITLYILFRENYFRLTTPQKASKFKVMNKTWVATIYILLSILIIAVPIFFAVEIISGKAATWISNPQELLGDAKIIDEKIHKLSGIHIFSDENMKLLQQKATAIIPKLLNSSANVLSNFAIMFFVMFFMLTNGREMEKMLDRLIPLKGENIKLLGNETKNMIKANAVGIPILALLQGFVAALGYWIFGVDDAILWGFISGIFSIIPIVGTAVVWLPLCLYLFATDKTGNAIGLLVYCAVLVSNIDYVARLTLLKRFMDIHPIVTVFGVIIGIGLFGFWGVIFGPLLISYFIILVKIYVNEFSADKGPPL